MKVTFPHMGNMRIVIKALLDYLEIDYVEPPLTSKRTLTLGVQNSPEFACLPLKVNMGNFIEAAELGADTILMTGGSGPCRFGYYAQVQREILADLGYNYEIICLDPPENHYSELTTKIKYLVKDKSWWQVVKAMRFAWIKARALDSLEEKVQKIRAREINQGQAGEVYRQGIKNIDQAKDKKGIKLALEQASKKLDQIPLDYKKDIVKVAVVGEIYTLLEPYVNLNIEEHLGKLNVEVNRSIFLSEWINDHLFYSLARIRSSKEARKMAPPYLNHFVGGHGIETIGSAVKYAREGYHGIIQLAPLTCMPEIVAQAILPKVTEHEGIPTMTIYLDEQTGEAGLMTRIEAFVDLLFRQSRDQCEVRGNRFPVAGFRFPGRKGDLRSP